jgi:DNA-binding NtrC family response regulator
MCISTLLNKTMASATVGINRDNTLRHRRFGVNIIPRNERGMPSTILIVTNDDNRLGALVRTLNGAGYRASGASTFAEAKQRLGDKSPDLLIADERLGAFNGLHVIILGRASDPEMKAIVASHRRDQGLEAEAKRLNVDCVVQPTSAADWLTSVSRALNHLVDAPEPFVPVSRALNRLVDATEPLVH